MVASVLLINSDLAKNRGDRAIAEGNIALIKQRFPGAIITGISQFPERDRRWYGIDFLPMDFQSLSPWQLYKLCRAARHNDIVLWGGGEILKDYTNKAALWYWVIKMTIVSLCNRDLYGAFQGIGPTSAGSSKRLIRWIVNRTKLFIVRDGESADKLIEWGVRNDKVLTAADPAVLPLPEAPDEQLRAILQQDFGIDKAFLDDFICIGPREWFHYKRGGLLPFKYTKHLPRLRSQAADPTYETYVASLRTLIRNIEQRFSNSSILLLPMHLEEGDAKLCHELRNAMEDPGRAVVLEKDSLSPGELRSLVSRAKSMVGFRLHSNIIGISAGVPSVNVYYVDKGRVFFDQIGKSDFSLPIEEALENGFAQRVVHMLGRIADDDARQRRDIRTATDTLRHRVVAAFNRIGSIE